MQEKVAIFSSQARPKILNPASNTYSKLAKVQKICLRLFVKSNCFTSKATSKHDLATAIAKSAAASCLNLGTA